MKIVKRCFRFVALFTSAFLLCAGTVVHADEIGDANLLFKQGQQSQALVTVNHFLASKPKDAQADAQARFLKGLILTKQGKTADAIKIFTGLTEDYPDLPEPYNNLAVLYASQGKYDKAKQLLEKALSTHPSYATANENLGDIYAKMASQAYDRALQLDNKDTATQTKLAMIQNLFADDAHNHPSIATTTGISSRTEGPILAKVVSAPAIVANNQPAPTPVASAVTLVTATAAKAEVAKAENAISAKQVSRKNDEVAIRQTVTAWAKAWSSQNTGQYLSLLCA